MAGGAFDTLLAVAQLQEQRASDGATAAGGGGGGGRNKEGLLGSIARDLLAMGAVRRLRAARRSVFLRSWGCTAIPLAFTGNEQGWLQAIMLVALICQAE